jgi:nitrite reductase (NO-forming)
VFAFLVASCGGGVSQDDFDALKARLETSEVALAQLETEEAGAAQPGTASPAEQTTVDEISRHPSELPDSAAYTLYENGQFLNPVDRDEGPITIEAHLTIREVVAEMVPGTTMDFWTFDGGIPGPMIRGRVGDTIDFYLHNPEENRLSHNVDFHAVTGPGGGAVRLDTRPGAVSRLQVKLLAPGIFIYHCAYPDIPMHISHGMYGLAVVEPEDGLPPVDHEYYVLQSDFYTKMGGEQPHTALKDAGHLKFSVAHGNLEEPTFVVFNGRPDSMVGGGPLALWAGP